MYVLMFMYTITDNLPHISETGASKEVIPNEPLKQEEIIIETS